VLGINIFSIIFTYALCNILKELCSYCLSCDCACTPAEDTLTAHSTHIMDSVSHNALPVICVILCSSFPSPHDPSVSLPIYPVQLFVSAQSLV